MTNKQKACYAMIKRLIAFCRKYEAKLTHISALNALVALLENFIIKADNLKEIQATDITGLASQKQNLRQTAVQIALQISRGIVAYARLTNNQTLAHEAYYTESDLNHMSDDNLDAALSVIDTKLDENSANLTQCGITADMSNAFKMAKTDYSDFINKPKQGTLSRKQATTQLSTETDKAMEAVGKIDLLMDTVRYTQPELYAEYADNRKVVVRAATLAAKVQVSDAITREGINGAHVVFSLDGQVLIDKTTAEGGGLSIKSLDENTYTVQVSKIGYQPQTLPFEVTDTDPNALEVWLTK